MSLLVVVEMGWGGQGRRWLIEASECVVIDWCTDSRVDGWMCYDGLLGAMGRSGW